MKQFYNLVPELVKFIYEVSVVKSNFTPENCQIMIYHSKGSPTYLLFNIVDKISLFEVCNVHFNSI